MKSQKGVTLTSLAIYIVVVLIVLGILAVISGTFQGNIKEIYTEGTNNAEIDKLNVYLLREVKRQGNEISTISNNEVVFTTVNKYTFSSANQCVFLNNNIKIAENIEKCVFAKSTVNGKTVITLTIKAVNSEEKTMEYVLNSNTYNPSYEDESDYTNNEIVVTEISFTLKGTTYTVEPGMTWEEWITENNMQDMFLYIAENTLSSPLCNANGAPMKTSSGDSVYPSDPIIADDYYFDSSGFPM